MPNYLSPGVYVEEVEAGSRPIEGVGTAVAAFVGLAARGPANKPTLVTNWSQFTSTFGDFIEGSYLAHAVYGYFLNGGGAAYVVRVGADGVVPTATRRGRQRADKAQAGATASPRSRPARRQRHQRRGRSPATADEGIVQARRQARRQGRRDVRQPDRPSKGKQNVATVVKAQSKTDHDRGGRQAPLERRPPPARRPLAGGARRGARRA